MAGFDVGYQSGLQRGSEAREHKQALSDTELQQKIGQQIDLQKGYTEKLRNMKPGDPGYDDAHRGYWNTFTELRHLYHPENNPNAISRLGHLLTDHLKITNPDERAGKQQFKETQALGKDEQAAQAGLGAQPPSDIEAAHRAVQAKMAGLQDELDQYNKTWDDNHKEATDAQKDAAHQENFRSIMLGYKPTATSERGYWETKKGTKPDPNDPTKRIPFSYSHNRYTDEYEDADHNPIGSADLQGFVEDAKSTRAPKYAWSKDKSGRIFSVQLDDMGQIKPGTENYNLLPPAGMLPTIRSGVYHWVDENNAVHETPETTTSHKDYTGTVGAGGAQPRTGTSNPPNGGNISTAPSRQSNLQSSALMKQKIAHNFEKQDRILGYKGNSVLTKAENNQSDADSIAETADKLTQQAETNPDNMAEADTNFVLKLIRSEAGRVNQQEIAMLFNAGGLAEGPERWAAKIGHGQLSTDLRNQLVEFAHTMREVADEEVARLKQHPGDSKAPAPAGGDWRQRAIPIK